jgi:hypothetical protein
MFQGSNGTFCDREEEYMCSDYKGCVHTDALSLQCLVERRFRLQLGPYPKGALPVKVTLPTHVSVALALSISIMLPAFSFGFPKQITANRFVQNYHNS